MLFSQKSQYALRAVFELARRYGTGPVRIADVADAQDVPRRFLESILSELRRGGFVTSHRGREGGYMLARPPEDISVADILRYIEGPIGPIECLTGKDPAKCTLRGCCVFEQMWRRVGSAMEDVLGETTIAKLVAEDRC